MGGCTNNRNKIERCHPWMGCEMMLDTPGYAWNICKITFFVYSLIHDTLIVVVCEKHVYSDLEPFIELQLVFFAVL